MALHLRLIAQGAILSMAMAACAQQPSTPPADPPADTPYTLRVYTNLVQLPTMVLDDEKAPVQNLTRDQFRARIDGGPWFKPTRLHIQGSDALELGILLDASGTEPELLREAPHSLSMLASGPLQASDTLGLYAFDCTVMQHDMSAKPDPQSIQLATRQLLDVPGLHGPPHPGQPTCLRSSKLIDSIAAAIHHLSRGDRRALVVLTDGFEHQSTHTWDELRQFASLRSVPVFVIRTNSYYAPPYQVADRRASIANLLRLSLTSGGLSFQIMPRELPETLAKIVFLLRTRYILEFPRPANATSGFHGVEVNIPKHDWLILTSGVEVKLPDEDEKSGANTIQGDHSTAPQQGKRAPKR